MHNLWKFHHLQVLVHLHDFVSLQGLLPLKGHVSLQCTSSSGVIILEIVGVASSRVLFSLRLGFCCPFIFLFRGIKSFEPKGRPHFRRVIDDSLAAIIAVFLIGILILASVFATSI